MLQFVNILSIAKRFKAFSEAIKSSRISKMIALTVSPYARKEERNTFLF